MADRDRAVAELAGGQFGIVDLSELVQLGIDKRAAWRRGRRGHLHRLHLGVYSVVPPHLLRPQGRWLAAVRAAGDGAVLSHGAAAALWELQGPPAGPVHLTVSSTSGRKRRNGLMVHRSSSLRSTDMTRHRGLPVTTPARTLRDLKRAVSPARFGALLRQAERQRLDTGPFATDDEVDASELERRLLALCRRHGLPLPRTQVVIGPYTVDFLWDQARLIVESDGFATHRSRAQFEADRARDAWLATDGYRVIRFTWRQLRDQPSVVIATLRTLLGIGA